MLGTNILLMLLLCFLYTFSFLAQHFVVEFNLIPYFFYVKIFKIINKIYQKELYLNA